MSCCGEPWVVGEKVSWNVDHGLDQELLIDALGPERAARITHTEQHHADEQEDLPEITGRVLGITRVWGAFGPGEPGEGLRPLRETARFIEVRESAGVERFAHSDLHFHGWIVELELSR